MRTTILTIALAALAVGAWTAPATAQQPGRRGPDLEARLERMKERLDLTDEQTDRVATIVADAMERRRAIRSEALEDREEVRERMRAVHETTRERLSEVLTDEQMERLTQMRAKGRPGGHEGRRGGRPGGRSG